MITAFLEGKRLYLRGLIDEDASGKYPNWFDDTRVCEFNSHHVFPYSQKDAEAYIRSTHASKDTLALAIVLKDKHVHIGNISLQKINFIDQTAEFAIIIGDRDFWGKGYSREAAELLFRHGFMELNLNRIYCGTSVDNHAMLKLAEELGMQMEGKRRSHMFKHGRYVDIIEFGVLKTEFLAKFGMREEAGNAK
jgi:ribosomal-protein-alanine N-acetyltransferase